VIAAAAHRILVGLLNTGLDQLLDAPSFTMESTAAELEEGAHVSNQTYTNPADIKLAVDEAFERLDLRQFGQNGVWTHAAILASQAAWKIRRDLDAAEDADTLYEELHDIGTAQPADSNLSLCLHGAVNAWWSDDRDLCTAAALLVERLLNPVETP
jgi:hypothetical protein